MSSAAQWHSTLEAELQQSNSRTCARGASTSLVRQADAMHYESSGRGGAWEVVKGHGSRMEGHSSRLQLHALLQLFTSHAHAPFGSGASVAPQAYGK